MTEPCVLFVPVSGSAGSGEVQRCRLLADALRARWPQVRPHFLLAAGSVAPPFAATPLSASPTRVPAEVAAAIHTLRPAVVVFDGNARVASLAAARAAGARTVLISSRPSARDRGLRWRRMARLDAHWLVGAELRSAPGWRERIARWRYPQVQLRRFATVFEPPAAVEALLQRLGLAADQPFVVVCAGGGRHPGAATLFGEVATRVAQAELATIAVGLPAAAPAIAIAELPNTQLMGLLGAARAAVLAGGSLLVQALALKVPTLALPLQDEQAARVRWLSGQGAVLAVAGQDAPRLAQALRALADDDAARARLQSACDRLALDNGLDAMTYALGGLAGLSRNPARANP